MEPFTPSSAFVDAVARVTGRCPAAWFTRAGCGGYTPALRLFVRFEDGGTAFVKAAVNELTAGWLRIEQRFYECLKDCSFLPAYYGSEIRETEDAAYSAATPEAAFLVLEDLSEAHWPPPWSDASVEAVLTALSLIRRAAPLAGSDLPNLTDNLAQSPCWHTIAAEPAEFLSLGMCSGAWLEACLPDLLAAAKAVPTEGQDLLHLDVRSDNICFRADGSAVLVDWNWACLGNGAFDIACWAPSLHSEGGPLPEKIAPGALEFAAWLAGFFGAQAGRPIVPDAPHVRTVQKKQLTVALPWAARVLGLPPPDGVF